MEKLPGVHGVGVVVIGRNEGERLVRCFSSLSTANAQLVYVDSGSTDGSVARVRSLFPHVLVHELDSSRPFSAARARNEGAEVLSKLQPAPETIQFIDGDCTIAPGWLETAGAHLVRNPDCAAVIGRLAEMHPEATIEAAELPKAAPPSVAGTPTGPSVKQLVSAPARAPSVLVLGGSGFIGRHLVSRLVDKGLAVRVASRNALAAAINLRGLAVDIVQGSLGDADFLRSSLQGIDTVYHLAKTDGKNWAHYLQHEVEVTRTIGTVCAQHGVKRFIYTGTIDSYDSANPSNRIDNSTALDANIDKRNHYARSKAMSEAILLRMHKESGFPVVIVRPGVVIGKGCPPAHWGVAMFVSESNLTYWGDGNNPLPLVLVEDVADALVKAYDTLGLEGRCLLVTDAPLMSARDYVAEVSRLSGMKIDANARSITSYYLEDVGKEALKHLSAHPNRRPPSRHDWACRALKSVFDSTDTQRVLGWTPRGTREALVQQGVQAAVDEAYR